MNEEILENLLNYDYTEIEKIPSQLEGINENTKKIIEELQKENNALPVLEPVEKIPEPSTVDETALDESEEVTPVEEVTEENIIDPEAIEEIPAEETLLVDGEEPTDYLELIYGEMILQNELNAENQLAVIEHLQAIEEQGIKGMEVDTMAGLYMMYLIPLAVVVSILGKVFNPFTRV